jgi:hypothetical protein
MATDFGLRITAAIPGWSEDATVELIKEIGSWHNLPCAEAAVDELCRTWTDSRRPTLGKVIEFYNGVMDVQRRRELMRQPARRDDAPSCPPSRGFPVLAREYEREKEANARRPDGHPEKVKEWKGAGGLNFDEITKRALGREQ